ncbi:UDP-galactopyranose mutase [Chaetoceros tenuissimus]|uniref:UDP-galactopyranose mutase n=1 Tax=Chaetoceros tenuissimus TaxID=426638 RepID=A0AAD3H6Q3_9STRA|nr:UDP-galactopyranose mutase [Chaetoceros tenuissimus]
MYSSSPNTRNRTSGIPKSPYSIQSHKKIHSSPNNSSSGTSCNKIMKLIKALYEYRGSLLLFAFCLYYNQSANVNKSQENVNHDQLRKVKTDTAVTPAIGKKDNDGPTEVFLDAHHLDQNEDEYKDAPPLSKEEEPKGTWMHLDPDDNPFKNQEEQQQQESATSTNTTTSIFQKEYYDVCIIGAGLSGSVIANQYSSLLQKTSLILEKRNHIGGNCYDYKDPDTNILVNKYGAHLFHTQYTRVWEYIQHFSHWTPYEHRVLGFIHDKHVPIPVNIDTVNALFELNISSTEEMNAWLKQEQVHFENDPVNSEEMAKSRVGERLYDMIFKPYTIKQWAKTPMELGPEVTARIPVRNDWDDRYFPGDVFQALPSEGYTKIFENMILNDALIETHLNVDYFDVRQELVEKNMCGHTFFSGPIDAYFSQEGYEKLEYRSLEFERKVIQDIGEEKTYLPASVVNYPSAEYNFTRIVEYKHYLEQKSPHTVLFYETSNDGGEPYYPVPNKRNQDLYKKYQAMALKEPNVTFVGRLANYKYFNMDQSILNALELFDQHAPRVVVKLDCDSSSFEYMAQIVKAFHSWMPYRTHQLGQKTTLSDTCQQVASGYDLKQVLGISTKDLRVGDVFITSEKSCPVDIIQNGVKVFIHQSHVPPDTSAIEKNIEHGCEYITSTFHVQNSIQKVYKSQNKFSRPHVMLPYSKQPMQEDAISKTEARTDSIIVQLGVSNSTISQLDKYCKEKSCQIKHVKDIKADELSTAFAKSKLIVQECIYGRDKLLMDAILAGMLLVTSDCEVGGDLRDFPIPRQHKLSPKASVKDVVSKLLYNFETEQKNLEGIRKVFREYNEKTLEESTKQFIFGQ